MFDNVDDYDANENFRLKILIVLIVGALCILMFKYETSEDYYNQKLADEHFQGTVIKHFINRESHDNETVICQDGKQTFEMNFRWLTLYDSCKVNDKVLKEKGKRVLYLIRPNRHDTLILQFDRNSINTGEIIFRFKK